MLTIPATVSGRRVTNRGVHLQPSGCHNFWIEKADYWVGLMQSMGLSWCVALTESDNLRISGAAEALLSGGIIPVVRFAYQFPRPWNEQDEVAQLQKLYARYNAPLIVQFGNEVFDEREWFKKKVPRLDDAWQIVVSRWKEAANLITERGAIAGWPDGPCYDRSPFLQMGDDDHHWEEGRAIYLGHFYGKNRPLDYPRDDVSRFGTPLTLDEYHGLLDDYADDPHWNERDTPLDMINLVRAGWSDPDMTALHDDTCWRGWELVMHWSREAFGYEVPIALTEGGWTPRDRAGSHPHIDIRWPYTTPKMVATRTLEMFAAESPLLFQCPWLLACSDMGATGWEFDAWHSGAYGAKDNLNPVILALQGATDSPLLDGLVRVEELLLEARGLLE